ncbi:probable prolyl 4-hydroxylase 7 isoform X2 [Phalaenopsis equestris]|uniref:probable prolyl 4-hydroxylase 7 isoform X2 n=1 Tax=Phalaenopsis equestris TaxID=78828 RepID=UPI0009E5449D|nr:probable prolyl 4-hydroxylase 7 isoform X2 [Phalaenopsis equestris]
MASLLQMSSHFLLVFLSFSRACSSRKWDLERGEAKIDPLLSSKDAALSSGFDPSKSIQLSWNPRVFLYEGFISNEECDHLLSLANVSKLNKPLAIDNSTGDGSSTFFVSSHSGLEHSKGQDEIILRIEERISAWTFLPNENGEDMQIFHYRVNEGSETLYQYNQGKIENGKAGPQIAAVLIFLSNVSLGGEIVFPKFKNRDYNTKNGKEMLSECASSGFSVKHVRSNALLIFNLHPNATVDESSLHGGCSVREGEKWSAIKRIHVRAFDRNELDRKKHSLDSKEECTDEDQNCSQWAAMGECQKNSVYMLGTSDYYGSCRKSCGVC